MRDNILSENDCVLLAQCSRTLSLSPSSFVSRLRAQEGDPMIERPEQHPENSESRDAQRYPDFAPPLRETETMPAAPEGWSRGEVEMAPPAAPPVPRDRILSPRVLIVWAALTLVAYFGIRLVGTVVRDSVQQAIVSSARSVKNNSGPDIVILLPNGKKITIHRDVPHPPRPPVIQGAATPSTQPTAVPEATTTPSAKRLPGAGEPPPGESKAPPTRR